MKYPPLPTVHHGSHNIYFRTLPGVPWNAMQFDFTSLTVCLAGDCGDPGTPANGQRSLSSTTYNSVVTYTCDVGYTLQGSNSRTCQSNGQWSGSVPQCIGKSVRNLYKHNRSKISQSACHTGSCSCNVTTMQVQKQISYGLYSWSRSLVYSLHKLYTLIV